MNKNYINNNFKNSQPFFWFYKLKGKSLINTEQEFYLSKDLPPKISLRFLETRGFIRQSLGLLFNINPLDVPLFSKPNRPPFMKNDFGFISISHCSDALIFVWDKQRIGVDLERKDRIFNHQTIYKKLLKDRNNINKKVFERLDILNLWCTYEAAIKWQRGSIISDINFWEFEEFQQIMINKNKNIILNVKQFYFYEWTISFASLNKYKLPIVCYS